MRGPLMEAAGDGTGGGGGGGGEPVFDKEKFRADFNADVNKILANQFKAFESNLDKKYAAKPAEEPPPEDPAKGGKPIDPEVAKLRAQLEKINARADASDKAREAADKRAEEKERHSLIRTELGKFQFAKENGIDAAFKVLGPDIKRNDASELVGPNDEPLGEYIASQLTTAYDFMLAPKQVGGSGATNGKGRGPAPVQLEDIKPGMKPEDLARVRQEIARVAAEALQGR